MNIDNTGISIRVAAYQLFEAGFSEDAVNAALNSMAKPCEGYVYATAVDKLIQHRGIEQ
jgi:hypothetical protein